MEKIALCLSGSFATSHWSSNWMVSPLKDMSSVILLASLVSKGVRENLLYILSFFRKVKASLVAIL